MTLVHVLKALGFDSEDVQRIWQDNPGTRLQERIARLSRLLKARYAALVRRRRIIESIKDRINATKLGEARLSVRVDRFQPERDQTWRRIARGQTILQRHESAYQKSLAAVVQMRQKLAGLQKRLALLEAQLH